LDRDTSVVIHRGDRIAQLIVAPVVRARFLPVDDLDDSVRGDGGFGSSGYAAEKTNGE
ncbi:MAG: dUTP diphosphatase, partial [Microbacterium gubbeenense]